MKNSLLLESPILWNENKEEISGSKMQWEDYKGLIKGMTFFDPHINMTSVTTIDYQAMIEAGVAAIIEPAFRQVQTKTESPEFQDYQKCLKELGKSRNKQLGIKHYCTIGLNSKEANNEKLAEQVMAILPQYLRREGVVGVGQIGFEDQTKAEEKYFRMQLELAKKSKMPIHIHTPHQDKRRGTLRSMDICNEHGIDSFMVIIDRNNEETMKIVMDKGFWAGFTVYPSLNKGSERMVEIIQKYGSEKTMMNSAGGIGTYDSLSVPKTAALMKIKGVSENDIKKVTYQNAINAFGQSGQIYLQDFQKTKAVQNINSYYDSNLMRAKHLPVKIRKSDIIK